MNFSLQFSTILFFIFFSCSTHANLCEDFLKNQNFSKKETLQIVIQPKNTEFYEKRTNEVLKIFESYRDKSHDEFLEARENRTQLRYALQKFLKSSFKKFNGHKYPAYFISTGSPAAARILAKYPTQNEQFSEALSHYKKIIKETQDFPEALKNETLKIEVFKRRLEVQKEAIENSNKKNIEKIKIELPFIDKNTGELIIERNSLLRKEWGKRLKLDQEEFNRDFEINRSIFKNKYTNSLNKSFLKEHPALQKIVYAQAKRLRQIEILLEEMKYATPESGNSKELKEKQSLITEARNLHENSEIQLDARSYLNFIFHREFLFEFHYWRDSSKRKKLNDDLNQLYNALTTTDRKYLGFNIENHIGVLGGISRKLSKVRVNIMLSITAIGIFFGADGIYTLESWLRPNSIITEIIQSPDAEYKNKLNKFLTKKFDHNFSLTGEPIFKNKLREELYTTTINEIALKRIQYLIEQKQNNQAQNFLLFTTNVLKDLNQYQIKTKIVLDSFGEHFDSNILTAMQKKMKRNFNLSDISKLKYSEWMNGKNPIPPIEVDKAFSREAIQYLIEIKQIQLNVTEKLIQGNHLETALLQLEEKKLFMLIKQSTEKSEYTE